MTRQTILIVEDSKLDTAIYKDILTGHGYSIENCTNGHDAIKKVCSDFLPDLILMDIELDGTLDGIETAHRILEIKQIPVVFLTATISEGIFKRVKTVSNYGFVQKGTDTFVLLSTIETALRLGATTAQLSLSEASLKEAQSYARLGRWDLNHLTNNLRWSDTIYEIFEIDKDKFGASYDAFLAAIHPDDRERVNRCWLESLDTKVPYEITHRLLMQDGRIKWVIEKGETLFDSQGQPVSTMGVVQDITEQMETEIQIQKLSEEYEQVFHGTQDSMFLIEITADNTFRYIRNNRAHQQQTGIKAEDMQGKTPAELHGENLGNIISANYRECVTSGSPLSYEETLDLPAGRKIWSTTLTPVFKNNRVAYIVGSSHDITPKKAAEEALKKSHERMQNILEGTNVGTWEWNVQTGETHFNERWAEIIGYTLSEISPVSIESWIGFTHPEDVRKTEEQLLKVFNKELAHYDIEYRMKHKDGHWVWVLGRGKVVSWTPDGKPHLMYGTHSDISARKQSEQELLESEQRFRVLYETTPVSILVHDRDTCEIVGANQYALDFYGVNNLSALQQLHTWTLDPPYSFADVQRWFAKVWQEGPQKFEWKSRNIQGEELWEEVILQTITLDGTERMLATSIDITQRKLALLALEASEAKYSSYVENAPYGVLVVDEEGNYIEVNKTASQISGYSTDELLQMNVRDTLPDEYEQSGADHFRELLEKGTSFGIIPYKHKNGSMRWFSINAVKLTENRFLGFERDVTGQILMEQALRQSEEKYRLIFERAPLGILHYDENGHITDCNDNFIQIIGSSREELIGVDMTTLPDPHITAAMREALQGKTTMYEGLYKSVTAEKETYIKLQFAPISTETVIQGGVGIIEDISEQREAQQKLVERDNLLTRLSMQVPGMIYQYLLRPDGTSCLPFSSKGIWDIFEVNPEDVKTDASVVFTRLHPDDYDQVLASIQNSFNNLSVWECTYRVILPEKGLGWVRGLARPEKLPDGSVLWHGYLQNIDELKKAEDLLTYYHALMQYVIEHNPSAVAVHDRDLNYIYVSQRYLNAFKLRGMDIVGMHHYDVFPSLPQEFKDVHQRALAGEVIRADDDLFIHEDGTADWACWECRPWYDADGTVGGFILYVDIITERKHMEQLIYFEKERLKTTLLSIGDGVITTDTNCNVVLMNPVAEALTGWPQQDAYGRPLDEVFRIIHEHTREKCENPACKVLETGGIVELANHTVLIAKDGTEWPIEDSAAPIFSNQNSGIDGVVLVFREVVEKRKKQAEVEYLSYHDQLTGLFNRRFFEKELKKLDTAEHLPLTLAICDANGLKLANDAFGHEVGDKVLIKLADVMQKECRSGDIIARIGGDEFVIILPKTNANQAKKIMERLSDSISNEKVGSIALSISCGWDTKYDVDESITTVFKRAEDHMYRNKLSESTSIHYKTIEVINQALYEKNEREEKHSKRVSELCVAIGAALQLTYEELNELRTVGLMHDIGKIAVEAKILDKPSKISKTEWLQVERHPEVGYQILSSVNEYAPLAEYVLSHHERWDGKGYPRGLQGEDIPLQARIIAIADAYDAMTSDRPYRKKLAKSSALKELKKHAGTQFDPEIIRVFLEKVIV